AGGGRDPRRPRARDRRGQARPRGRARADHGAPRRRREGGPFVAGPAARRRSTARAPRCTQRSMIQIGDRLPDATLFESSDLGPACPVAHATVSVAEAPRGKRSVIFGRPGAYTPTCSAKHVPGYVEHLPELRAKGVDEVW